MYKYHRRFDEGHAASTKTLPDLIWQTSQNRSKSFTDICKHIQVLYAARRGFYFVLPKPGSKQQQRGGDGEGATAGEHNSAEGHERICLPVLAAA